MEKHIMKATILHKAAAVLLLGAVALVPSAASAAPQKEAGTYRPEVTFTLRTGVADGKLVFIGEKGNIKDQVNPDLNVPEGSVVQINLINGDGAIHDIALPEFKVDSDEISGKGSSTAVVFRVGKAGEFKYICTLPGHVQAGMVGNLIVGDGAVDIAPKGMEVAQDPTAVGKPVGKRGPQTLNVDLETTEVIGQLSD